MKSMEALKCDLCGACLIIDDSREFAKCEFCGTKYMKSTLQQKIQEIRGTVQVEGAVETVKGEAEKERLLKNAETLIKIEKYSDAEKQLRSVTDQFPDEHKAWWQIYCIPFLEFINSEDCLSFPYIGYSAELKTAFKLHDYTDTYKAFWEKIAVSYFQKCDKPYFEFGNLFEDISPQIPNDSFKKIKKDVQNRLEHSDRVIEYMTFTVGSGYGGKIRRLLESRGLSESAAYELVKGSDSYYQKYIFKRFVNNSLYVEHNDYQNNETHCEKFKLNADITFKDMGLCQYCGGSFNGVFSKTCSKCGKPKDY